MPDPVDVNEIFPDDWSPRDHAFNQFANAKPDDLARYILIGGDLSDLSKTQRELLANAVLGKSPKRGKGRPTKPRRDENIQAVMAFMEGGGSLPNNNQTLELMAAWVGVGEDSIKKIWNARDKQDRFLRWLKQEGEIAAAGRSKQDFMEEAEEFFSELQSHRDTSAV